MQILLTAYSLFLIGFAVYFTLLYSKARVERSFEKRFGVQKAIIFYVGLEKISGFLLMLVLPLSVLAFFKDFDAMKLGIELTNPARTFMWWGIFGTIVLTVNLIRAGKPANYNLYPQIRTEVWTVSLLGYYILGWALYLLGYEFLFRGILFFAGIDILPLWLNIILNTVLYALAHLPKGRLEILASLPFGVVLCLISYNTGNFWAAWLIHLTLALSNSMIAIKANPKMIVDFKKF